MQAVLLIFQIPLGEIKTFLLKSLNPVRRNTSSSTLFSCDIDISYKSDRTFWIQFYKSRIPFRCIVVWMVFVYIFRGMSREQQASGNIVKYIQYCFEWGAPFYCMDNVL